MDDRITFTSVTLHDGRNERRENVTAVIAGGRADPERYIPAIVHKGRFVKDELGLQVAVSDRTFAQAGS